MADSCEFHQCSPEFGDEQFVMVTNDLEGTSILAVPFVKEKEWKILY